MESITNKQHPGYRVLVRCFTYNHAKFIEDALSGFSLQETNFPYVCVIVDDASTDGEQNVIKAFLTKHCNMSDAEYSEDALSFCIKVSHTRNCNCTFVVYLLKENLYKEGAKKLELLQPWRNICKYEALCEGDDFWVDPHKLQKQFDALEADPSGSFVYTGFNTVDETGNVLANNPFEARMNESHSGVLFFDLLVNMNFIMTLTTFFRMDVVLNQEPFYYDYGIFLNASRQGRGIYLPERTSCYRVNPNSIMNTSPTSLLPRLYKTVLIEIDKCLQDKTTSELVNKHDLCNTVVGYILARYINKSLIKKHFFAYLLKHPFLLGYTIKGVIIRITRDSDFRKRVKII